MTASAAVLAAPLCAPSAAGLGQLVESWTKGEVRELLLPRGKGGNIDGTLLYA